MFWIRRLLPFKCKQGLQGRKLQGRQIDRGGREVRVTKLMTHWAPRVGDLLDTPLLGPFTIMSNTDLQCLFHSPEMWVLRLLTIQGQLSVSLKMWDTTKRGKKKEVSSLPPNTHTHTHPHTPHTPLWMLVSTYVCLNFSSWKGCFWKIETGSRAFKWIH